MLSPHFATLNFHIASVCLFIWFRDVLVVLGVGELLPMLSGEIQGIQQRLRLHLVLTHAK